MKNNLRFQLLLLENGTPVAIWHGTPGPNDSTDVRLSLEDSANVLSVCEILLGLATELLPDPIKPKGLVLREVLGEYQRSENENDIPF